MSPFYIQSLHIPAYTISIEHFAQEMRRNGWQFSFLPHNVTQIDPTYRIDKVQHTHTHTHRLRKSGHSNPKLLLLTHEGSTSLWATGELSIMPCNLPYTLTPHNTHTRTIQNTRKRRKMERGTEKTYRAWGWRKKKEK